MREFSIVADDAFALLGVGAAPRSAATASTAHVVGTLSFDGVIQEGLVDAPPHTKRSISVAVFFLDVHIAAIRVRVFPSLALPCFQVDAAGAFQPAARGGVVPVAPFATVAIGFCSVRYCANVRSPFRCGGRFRCFRC